MVELCVHARMEVNIDHRGRPIVGSYQLIKKFKHNFPLFSTQNEVILRGSAPVYAIVNFRSEHHIQYQIFPKDQHLF